MTKREGKWYNSEKDTGVKFVKRRFCALKLVKGRQLAVARRCNYSSHGPNRHPINMVCLSVILLQAVLRECKVVWDSLKAMNLIASQ